MDRFIVRETPMSHGGPFIVSDALTGRVAGMMSKDHAERFAAMLNSEKAEKSAEMRLLSFSFLMHIAASVNWESVSRDLIHCSTYPALKVFVDALRQYQAVFNEGKR